MTGRFASRSAGALTEKYLLGFLLAGRITAFPLFLPMAVLFKPSIIVNGG
jgi:hypothetical protein